MREYTYDDYIEWDGRWELIDGAPIPIPPEQSKEHRELSVNALIELEEGIKDCDMCLVVGSADWKISNDTIVRPEISLICDEPNGAYITKSPELIIEILEDDREDYYRNIKLDLYRNNRVKYYILLNQKENIAEAFKLVGDEFKRCGRFSSEKYSFELDKCWVNLDFSKIFTNETEH
jgi:Uma2 family endonuclease